MASMRWQDLEGKHVTQYSRVSVTSHWHTCQTRVFETVLLIGSIFDIQIVLFYPFHFIFILLFIMKMDVETKSSMYACIWTPSSKPVKNGLSQT